MGQVRVLMKSIVLDDGQTYSCHVVDRVFNDVDTLSGNLKVSCNLRILSYKDKATYESGLYKPKVFNAAFSNLQADPNYDAASMVYINYLISTTPLDGALIELANIPQPQPFPDPA